MKENKVNNSKIFIYSASIFVLALLFIYSALWFYSSVVIQENITRKIEELSRKGVTIENADYSVKGFPFKHIIVFKGKVSYGLMSVNIPVLNVKGFLLNGQFIEISAPNGVEIFAMNNNKGFSVKVVELYFETRIPDEIPSDFTESEMRIWQENGNNLLFRDIYAKINHMTMTGDGEISLDNNFQPRSNFNLRVTDYDLLLNHLKNESIITEDAFKMFNLAAKFISKQDSETQEIYIDLPVILDRSLLRIGPAKIANIGFISWK